MVAVLTAHETQNLMARGGQVIAGVDGCKMGWIAAVEGRSGETTVSLFRNFVELLNRSDSNVVVVDVPIGLTEIGPRAADIEARRMLGPRGCCVFPAPIRPILDSSCQQEASAQRRKLEGKGVPAQLWCIVPKIREVDAVMRAKPFLQERVWEGHPEVSFAVMNGRQPILARKRKIEGAEARRTLLAEHFTGVEYWLKELPRLRIDILDAFAMLWTARRVAAGAEVRFPERAELDRFGLYPRIVA